MIPGPIVAVVWCCGSDRYFKSAATAVKSLLINTDLDVVVATPDPDRLPLVKVPRLTVLKVDGVEHGRRADPFIGKFSAIEAVLHEFDNELLLMIDADCRVSQPWNSSDLSDLLQDADFALAEQPGITGTAMNRASFLEHYLSVSLPGVLPHGAPPGLEEFRYYNTGVVLGRRRAWTQMLQFAQKCAGSDNSLEINDQMVADQDIIQVWLNSTDEARVAVLDVEVWNASDLWCDVDNDQAKVIHHSNFCQGPTDELISASLPLDGVEFVIVTHESEQVVSTAIESAWQSGADRVVVVDNASTDGTRDLVRRSGAHLVSLDVNVGFATGANLGLLHCIYSDVILMNPDVIIDAETVGALRATIQADPDALVAPHQMTETYGRLGIQSPMTRLHLLRSVLENSGRVSSRTLSLLASLDHFFAGSRLNWLLGSCLASTQDSWMALQGFNTDFFLYMEDVELCERWSASGRPIILIDASVQHAMGTGSNIAVEQRIRSLNEARIRYANDRYGRGFARLLEMATR